jgi:hypothetical protein
MAGIRKLLHIVPVTFAVPLQFGKGDVVRSKAQRRRCRHMPEYNPTIRSS